LKTYSPNELLRRNCVGLGSQVRVEIKRPPLTVEMRWLSEIFVPFVRQQAYLHRPSSCRSRRPLSNQMGNIHRGRLSWPPNRHPQPRLGPSTWQGESTPKSPAAGGVFCSIVVGCNELKGAAPRLAVWLFHNIIFQPLLLYRISQLVQPLSIQC
jgi:hypothetical protein